MKKLLAMTAIAAVATPVMAANVEMPTVYGKLNRVALYTDNDTTGRTSFSGFTDVDSSESRLGVKGKWEIEGVKGTYVLEAGLNSSNTNETNDTDYRIRMRQAAVGADTKFGTIKMGQTYTPLDAVMLKSDPLSSTVASMAGSDTSARIDGAKSKLGFRYRARNDQFSYETPSMGGLTVALSTDRNNGMSNVKTNANTYGNTHYSALVRYQRKMDKIDVDVYGGYDFENKPGSDNSNDYMIGGLNLGLSNFKINLGYSVETTEAASVETEINRMLAGITYTLNKNVFAVTYQNRDEKDANNEYTQIAAHYKYMFTKNLDMNLTVLTYDVDETAGTQNEATMAAAGIQIKF